MQGRSREKLYCELSLTPLNERYCYNSSLPNYIHSSLGYPSSDNYPLISESNINIITNKNFWESFFVILLINGTINLNLKLETQIPFVYSKN